MLFCVAAGTIALFSRTATSSGNKISSGTLYIGKENGEKGALDTFIALKDMIPGAEPEKLELRVKNLGTMPAYLSGISAEIEDGDEKFVANALRVVCTDGEGNVLYKGSLLALDGDVVPLRRKLAMEPDKTTRLNVSVQLDERAGNWYKGKEIEFSLAVHAGQRPDQPMAGMVTVAEADNVQAVLDQAQPGDVVLIPPGRYGRLAINVPGVAVKAQGVVFDTEVEGFLIDGRPGEVSSPHGKKGKKHLTDDNQIWIQGLTINDLDAGGGIVVRSGQTCIADNIISSEGNAVFVDGHAEVNVTRNDLTGSAGLPCPPGSGNGLSAHYNLGVDLDPEKYAL
ncbi:MAG TPA: hypothetical protein GXX19_02600 [Syntrophomonadaceae bacterium]|nr:hypothetical protein [Syntrophomonadaceae bacterium]